MLFLFNRHKRKWTYLSVYLHEENFFDRWMGLFFGIHRKCISLKARGTLRSHSIWRCSEFFSSARINRFVTQTAKMKAIISPTENGWDQYFDYMFHFLSTLDRHFTYVGWRWVLKSFRSLWKKKLSLDNSLRAICPGKISVKIRQSFQTKSKRVPLIFLCEFFDVLLANF